MIDLVNGLILFLTGLLSGAAIHSLWRHAQERNETQDWNKIIREDDKVIQEKLREVDYQIFQLGEMILERLREQSEELD